MITKAVIPAAGFGTRFLPATKSQPKEMLPIVDTPTIQYVVEEAVASGITDILMIIGKAKRAIEEHFDRSYELEDHLRTKEKFEELEAIQSISRLADIHFVWQKEMKGLGDAIGYAAHHVNNEPFAVLLGDTLIESSGEPVTKQLISVYNTYQEPVVALEEVAAQQVSRYGIAGVSQIEDKLFRIDRLVEKPAADQAPSRLAIASRYILTPDIFEKLRQSKPGFNDEVQLTDAMAELLGSRNIYGLLFDGKRYDIGNKFDFLKTNIRFGLMHPEIREELRAWLRKLSEEL